VSAGACRAWLRLAALYWPLTVVLLAWVFGLTGCGVGIGLALGRWWFG
jgi:hypothetical protein